MARVIHNPDNCGLTEPLCELCNGWSILQSAPGEPVPFNSPEWRALPERRRKDYADYVAEFGFWPVSLVWRWQLHVIRCERQSAAISLARDWDRDRKEADNEFYHDLFGSGRNGPPGYNQSPLQRATDASNSVPEL